MGTPPGESNSATFSFPSLLNEGSTLEEKSFLLKEQILCFKIKPHLGHLLKEQILCFKIRPHLGHLLKEQILCFKIRPQFRMAYHQPEKQIGNHRVCSPL